MKFSRVLRFLRPAVCGRAIGVAVAFLIFALATGQASAGKIVLANDEWTWSDFGFAQAGSDSGTYALNVANFFSGGGSGNFLVLSNDFGLTETTLANTMTGAGHSWTIDSGVPVTAANLGIYDGVFLAGPTASGSGNAAALISYVNSGGNVYLAGGTGDFAGGDPAAEALEWSYFLNNFGLAFGSPYNGIAGVVPISSSHPVFAGVSGLYQNNGNNVLDLQILNPVQAVLVTDSAGNGLYAVYDSSIPEPGTLAIFAAGLAALGFAARRRRTH